MAEVGLVVTADDKATAVLKSIGDTGGAAFTKLRSVVNGVGPAFQSVTDTMAKMNQVMELVVKAQNAFRIVVADNVRVALEFRDANDPVLKQFQEMERSIGVLRARIGDVFIPIIVGLSKAFTGAGNSVVDFININRKLIATNITTFLADSARILIKGVTVGAIAASRAWAGWQEIIGTVQAGVETFFSVLLSANASALTALAKVAGFFDDDLAASIQGVADASAEMGQIFSESADENIKKVQEQIAAQEELEKKILRTGEIATKFVGEAEIAILDRIKNSQIGLNFRREEGIAKIKETKEEVLDSGKAIEDEIRAAGALAGSIAAGIGDNFVALADGTKTLGEATRDSILDTAETTILAAAASAAAKQLEAHAFLPFVGIAIGTAAAAAIFGIIRGQLTKFQFGGVVRGGSPNKDSVPALLTPGERILTQRQNRDFEAGRGGGGGGTVAVTLAPTFQTLTPPTSRAERRNMLLTLAPDLEQLVRDGLINLSPAGA